MVEVQVAPLEFFAPAVEDETVLRVEIGRADADADIILVEQVLDRISTFVDASTQGIEIREID
jgi:hypothetical protein